MFLTALYGCQGSETEQTPNYKAQQPPLPLPEQAGWGELLPGQWVMDSLHVELNARHPQPDSHRVMAANQQQWLRYYGNQPIRRLYSSDNRFAYILRNSQGELLQRESGSWLVAADSLVALTYRNSGELDSTVYQLHRYPQGVLFQALVDFDGDGENDDAYTGYFYKVDTLGVPPKANPYATDSAG